LNVLKKVDKPVAKAAVVEEPFVAMVNVLLT